MRFHKYGPNTLSVRTSLDQDIKLKRRKRMRFDVRATSGLDECTCSCLSLLVEIQC